MVGTKIVFAIIGIAGIAMFIVNYKKTKNVLLYGVALALFVGGFGGGARLFMYDTRVLDIIIVVIFIAIVGMWVVLLWVLPLIKKINKKKEENERREAADTEPFGFVRNTRRERDAIPKGSVVRHKDTCFVEETGRLYSYNENTKKWEILLDWM